MPLINRIHHKQSPSLFFSLSLGQYSFEDGTYSRKFIFHNSYIYIYIIRMLNTKQKTKTLKVAKFHSIIYKVLYKTIYILNIPKKSMISDIQGNQLLQIC